jgi:hypothetical protein
VEPCADGEGDVRGVRDRRRTKNRPLNAFVEDGVLTIEIGVDVLAFACLHETTCREGRFENRVKTHIITDAAGFAGDVACEMLAEAEDGSSLLTKFFDEAINQAIDQGAEHFEPIEAESDR